MTVDTAKKDFQKTIQYLSDTDKKKVLYALNVAEELHKDQLRESGEQYIQHPIAVALYLAKLEASKDLLVASLLHDAVEDEHTTLNEVRKEFGELVANLVDGLTKLSKRRYEGRMPERQVASLRKMLLTAHDDLRIILIKLADRKHNIETINALPKDKRVRIAHETLDIYVPFARLVGLWCYKDLFENVCFPIAYPEESVQWKNRIAEQRSIVKQERNAFVKDIDEKTVDDVSASLQEMTDYEIYTKMQGNIYLIDNVRNIDSVHIVLKSGSLIDCYRVLGEIHAQYPVHVGSFRDYISSPQANGYRALHTTIFLSQDHEVRLRIQTNAMNEHSTNRKVSSWLTDEQSNVYTALSGLHTAPISDNGDYVQDLKQTVLSRPIHVFTTSGGIFSMPKDSTGVDFAFAVNPDNLSYLAGIRIDGELLEATHLLHDGDTVDLVLTKNGQSELHTMWIDKVKSVEAREKIKHSLRQPPKQRRQKQGWQILKQEFQKRRVSMWSLNHLHSLQQKVADAVKCESYEQMLEQIGTGSLSVLLVIDTYKNMIINPKSLYIKILKLLGLLSRTRVFNREATIIDIEVYSSDRPGLIYGISQCFADRHINISNFFVYAVPPSGALYKIRLEVKNFEEFSDLYDAILEVPDVEKVVRVR